MKKSLALLTAALWPVAALAQFGAPVATGAATPSPAAAPVADPKPPPTLDRVEFQDADLPSIIEYLKAKNDQLGGNQRDLNIIIAPGIERLRVPMVSLRNVTVNDVIAVATTVLNLQLEPVTNQVSGETVAWIVKAIPQQNAFGALPGLDPATGLPSGPGGPVGPGPVTSFPSPPGTPGTTATPAPGTPQPENVVVTPAGVVELAAGGGGGLIGANTAAPNPPAAAPRPVTKVFGISALIASSKGNPDERAKEQAEKFNRLIASLQSLANDQGQKTEVRAYGNMEIIVVKSEDQDAITLIAETIEALKMNAATQKADAASRSLFLNQSEKSGAR